MEMVLAFVMKKTNFVNSITTNYSYHPERSWVFTTISDFLISISLQSDDVNLWYFKLKLLGLTEFIVWNIKGLQHWVAKT